MVASATLSSKYRICIPKTVRDEQRWEAGQEFVFIPKGKGVLIMPATELERLAGLAKRAKQGRLSGSQGAILMRVVDA
jgi:AbrB family looped-hinge helix DNA binding protein